MSENANPSTVVSSGSTHSHTAKGCAGGDDHQYAEHRLEAEGVVEHAGGHRAADGGREPPGVRLRDRVGASLLSREASPTRARAEEPRGRRSDALRSPDDDESPARLDEDEADVHQRREYEPDQQERPLVPAVPA